MLYDVAVVGGGVIGAFCARELKKYELNVIVLEGSEDILAGASRANSGIVHAGFDAPAGTCKAKFNFWGNQRMQTVCAELGVKYAPVGSLVLAGAQERQTLEELMARGKKNGVPNLEILDRSDLMRLEPNVSLEAAWALWAPTGGIVCPYGLTIAAMGNAMDNGVELRCGFFVDRVEPCSNGWALYSSASGSPVHTKVVVNCAGFGAERLANLFNDDTFQIGARKGEYLLLDKAVGNYVSHTIFSVPTAAGKGVLLSPTVDGNIIVGPTSVEEREYDTSIRRDGFEEIRQKASKLMRDIPFSETITSFAGVRAYCDRHDFLIDWSKKAAGLFHVVGIESPGLTSAPAIGEFVANKISHSLQAKKNCNFNPIRKPQHWFHALNLTEKNKVIQQKPAFGKVICRCEEVTLGEIFEALHNTPPAHTIDGVKLRTRAGMGRCQGGFCLPSVFNTIMKEYGIQAKEITKNGGKSYIIVGGDI